ncbi:MAG: aspartate kinase [Fervidobacterium sp.]
MEGTERNVNFFIFKVGGSVLSNPQDTEKVVKSFVRLRENKKNFRFVIVVSAFKGVTNKLVNALDNVNNLDVEKFLDELYIFHKSFILEGNESIFQILKQQVYSVERLLIGSKMIGKVPDFLRDKILCYGERLSAIILNHNLNTMGLNCEVMFPEDFIVTDGVYGNSNVLLEKSRMLVRLSMKKWEESDSIIPGFYGRSVVDGNITILGRGGSDYTATALGYCLDAVGVVLIKDVPGFLTGDPRITKVTKTVKSLTYAEADELSYFGAKILHHNAVEPLRLKNIPLYVCDWKSLENFEFSSFDNCDGCTVIFSSNSNDNGARIKSVSMTNDIAIIQFRGHNIGRVPGILGEIASCVSQIGVNIKFVITSQTSIVLIISKKDLDAVMRISEQFKIKEIEDISYSMDKSLIAVVGSGLLNYHGIASRIFKAVANGKINVEMISAGASDVSIYFIVNQKDGEKALQLVHNEFFG